MEQNIENKLILINYMTLKLLNEKDNLLNIVKKYKEELSKNINYCYCVYIKNSKKFKKNLYNFTTFSLAENYIKKLILIDKEYTEIIVKNIKEMTLIDIMCLDNEHLRNSSNIDNLYGEY